MAQLVKGKVITEYEIRSSATKFFNFFVTQLHDVHNISDRVHEGKLHEGDDWHTIGSIKSWTISIEGKAETFKENIESIDEKNKSLTFNVFDGEISKNYKTLKKTVQLIDKEDGNSGGIIIWTYNYEKLNEDIEPPYRYLEFSTAATKDIDAHLFNGQN